MMIRRPEPVSFYQKKALARMFASIILVLVFCVFAICIIGHKESVFKADIGVVLGSEVYSNGECSPRLKARLDKGLQLYKLGFYPKLVVSGGPSTAGIIEAEAMRNYLVSKGMDSQYIIMDPDALNTRGTAIFTARYLKEHELSSAIAVSQFYHLPRAAMAFSAEGVPMVGTAYADYYSIRDVFGVLREIPAIMAYWAEIK